MSHAEAAYLMGKAEKQIAGFGVSRKKGTKKEIGKRRALRMRSHEERVAAVRQRVAQIERQKRQRRNRLWRCPRWQPVLP